MFYDALKVRQLVVQLGRMASWLVLYLQQCNMDKLRAIKYQLIHTYTKWTTHRQTVICRDARDAERCCHVSHTLYPVVRCEQI